MYSRVIKQLQKANAAKAVPCILCDRTVTRYGAATVGIGYHTRKGNQTDITRRPSQIWVIKRILQLTGGNHDSNHCRNIRWCSCRCVLFSGSSYGKEREKERQAQITHMRQTSLPLFLAINPRFVCYCRSKWYI